MQFSMRQPEVAYVKRVSQSTLLTIPAICKRNFFSVKAVILTSFVRLCASSNVKNFWATGEEFWLTADIFSEQTSRRLLSSFVRLWREYSAYRIPCLAATIDHSRNLLAATNGCYKNDFLTISAARRFNQWSSSRKDTPYKKNFMYN